MKLISRKNVLIFLVAVILFAIFVNYGEEELLPTQIFLADTNTVIIDAGHGGMDGGAQTSDGVLEKDLNLEIAKILEVKLLLLGYDVIMTRDSDIALSDGDKFSKSGDLENRVLISRENPNAIFVSVHMNTFRSAKYSGSQVYYSKNNENSLQLANAIQESIVAYIQPENDRAVKKADNNIYILKEIEAPAVVVECGFLTNEAEATLLKSPTYQDQIADAIALAIDGYFSGENT